MDFIFASILVFLAVLAIFDLVVGVSNDAVNFLNSAIGAKVAPFKVILLVAAVGVFAGAVMSNGMMEIARSGIYNPAYFTFYEVMIICLSIMVTDVILLNVFNTLGMPTSTTVSMVFELLGSAFCLAAIKVATGFLDPETGIALDLGNLLNSSKAIQVIIGIFMSVAIAFFFGSVVQWITRLIFTFNYKRNLKYFAGIFGGIALTAIVYFMLIKGLSGSSLMTPEMKGWIALHNAEIILGGLLGFSILMQLLHMLGVNVLKVIVLAGTLALSLAFAGNDLVNFIGVPLAGLSAYQDYALHGGGAYDSYFMGANVGPATTPWYYLVGAGMVMMLALIFSKKAQNVVKTSISLSRQDEGEELFGSSGIAKGLVRLSTNIAKFFKLITPKPVGRWVNARFNKNEMILENGAAFDLIRASVNLVLSALLIAVGTSYKLPLSTTYVTFMVAMGSSLADRAWGRESAVARITGVMSVIGGWFITAGAAFIIASLVALAMYYGGFVAMALMIALAIFLLFNSHLFSKKRESDADDEIFVKMLGSTDQEEIWQLLSQHVKESQLMLLEQVAKDYIRLTDGFVGEDIRKLRKVQTKLSELKQRFKGMRRKEAVGLRMLTGDDIIEKNMWYHLGSNACMQMFYALERASDICREHVDNNYNPMPESYTEEFLPIRDQVVDYIYKVREIIAQEELTKVKKTKAYGKELRLVVKDMRKVQMKRTQVGLKQNFRVSVAYMNVLQETNEIINNLRHLLGYSQQLFENKRFDDESLLTSEA